MCWDGWRSEFGSGLRRRRVGMGGGGGLGVAVGERVEDRMMMMRDGMMMMVMMMRMVMMRAKGERGWFGQRGGQREEDRGMMR